MTIISLHVAFFVMFQCKIIWLNINNIKKKTVEKANQSNLIINLLKYLHMDQIIKHKQNRQTKVFP